MQTSQCSCHIKTNFKIKRSADRFRNFPNENHWHIIQNVFESQFAYSNNLRISTAFRLCSIFNTNESQRETSKLLYRQCHNVPQYHDCLRIIFSEKQNDKIIRMY